MNADTFIFWFLALLTLASGLGVILLKNPIFSALSLVFAMVNIAAIFVTLNAYFLAGVQLIVYAGAVMVLFVMVLMLFDLKAEVVTFTKGLFTGVMKLATIGMLGGLVTGAIVISSYGEKEALQIQRPMEATKSLGYLLFTEHVLGFELLGILLLIIAIGAVALARSKGGTHE